MKRTIKQWCKERDVAWLGQGSTGGARYDWKLVLGKGRTAIFTNIVEGPLPETRRIGKHDVLLFPNVNPSSKSGKISKAAFLRIIAWVEDCLAGNIRELKAPNQAPEDIDADVGKNHEVASHSFRQPSHDGLNLTDIFPDDVFDVTIKQSELMPTELSPLSGLAGARGIQFTPMPIERHFMGFGSMVMDFES